MGMKIAKHQHINGGIVASNNVYRAYQHQHGSEIMANIEIGIRRRKSAAAKIISVAAEIKRRRGGEGVAEKQHQRRHQ